MLSIAYIIWATFSCITGLFIVVWPDKTRHKLCKASNSTIRCWGVYILFTGIWFLVAIVLFNIFLKMGNTLAEELANQ